MHIKIVSSRSIIQSFWNILPENNLPNKENHKLLSDFKLSFMLSTVILFGEMGQGRIERWPWPISKAWPMHNSA